MSLQMNSKKHWKTFLEWWELYMNKKFDLSNAKELIEIIKNKIEAIKRGEDD